MSIVAVAGLTLAGCNGSNTEKGNSADKGPPSGKPRIIFVTNSNSDYWSASEKGMKDAAEALGVDAEMKRNNDGTTEGQIRLLEEALSANDVKGVAVSVVEAEAPGISDAMKKLKDAGKKVITVDSDVAPSYADVRQAYVGSNNAKAGELAGQAAKQLRPEGGTVAMFVGTASASNSIERRDGFYAGAGDKFVKPPVEIFEDGADTNKAQTFAQTAITKYPDVGTMLGLYSYNGPRIAEEVSKAPAFRKKTTVVVFDMDEQLIQHLEKGNVDVTVCQNPYEMGYQAIKLLKAMAQDDKKVLGEMLPGDSRTVDTGLRVVVPSDDSPVKGKDVMTIKAMKEWLASKGIKSS